MKDNLILFFIVVCASATAQGNFTPVNMEKTKNAVADKNSSTSYEKLMERFSAFDTTLTGEEYRLIYYGYVYQPGFSAYPDEKKGEINTALRGKDYKKALGLAEFVLAKYPLSLAANYFKGFALFNLYPDKMDYIKYRDRFKFLTAAIISSGDGLTCETGFKTISVSDEYMIIYNYFNVEKFSGQALVGHCDKLNIEPSSGWANKEIYFDASEILKKEAELFHH